VNVNAAKLGLFLRCNDVNLSPSPNFLHCLSAW